MRVNSIYKNITGRVHHSIAEKSPENKRILSIFQNKRMNRYFLIAIQLFGEFVNGI